MADYETVKNFTKLAKIGSGLSLSALFPAVFVPKRCEPNCTQAHCNVNMVVWNNFWNFQKFAFYWDLEAYDV